MRVLWLGLLGSHVVLMVMIAAHLARGAEGNEMPPHLPEMLGALALGLAVVSVVFPAKAFDQGLRSMAVRTTNEVGEAVGSFRESAPVTKVVADPEQAVVDAFARFQTAMIVGLSLAEAISLFGFMIGFMGGPVYGYAPFFALGIALTLSKFPRLVTITSAIERVKGARCELKP